MGGLGPWPAGGDDFWVVVLRRSLPVLLELLLDVSRHGHAGGYAHGAAEVWPRTGSVSAVEVEGAEHARISCVDSTCRTVVQVGEDAYWFETKRVDRDDVIASLGRFFEAVDGGTASAG